MATPFDEAFGPEFMGLLAQGIPAADVVPNPMPPTAPSAGLLGGGPSTTSSAYETPPIAGTSGGLTPDLQRIEQLLAGGSIGKGMSLGDKLTTLGAVLSAAAYGGNPAEVMQNARNQQIAGLQARIELEKYRASMQKEARFKNAVAQHASTIKDPQERAKFLNATTETQQKILDETAMPTPFQMTDIGGEKYMVFRSGPPKKLDLPVDVKGEWRSYDINNDGVAEDVFINERTGEPILNKEGKPLTLKLGMTPEQKDASARGWANVGISRARLAADLADGGGGRKEKEAKDIWILGPGNQPMKVRGISQGGNRYKVGNTVVEAVPSPARGRDDEYGL